MTITGSNNPERPSLSATSPQLRLRAISPSLMAANEGNEAGMRLVVKDPAHSDPAHLDPAQMSRFGADDSRVNPRQHNRRAAEMENLRLELH